MPCSLSLSPFACCTSGVCLCIFALFLSPFLCPSTLMACSCATIITAKHWLLSLPLFLARCSCSCCGSCVIIAGTRCGRCRWVGGIIIGTRGGSSSRGAGDGNSGGGCREKDGGDPALVGGVKTEAKDTGHVDFPWGRRHLVVKGHKEEVRESGTDEGAVHACVYVYMCACVCE